MKSLITLDLMIKNIAEYEMSSSANVNLPGVGLTGRRPGSCVSADEKIFTGPTYIGEVQLGNSQHFLTLRLRLDTFSGLSLETAVVSLELISAIS